MKIYSHRGNLDGPSEWENNPSHVKEAIEEKFYIEVDCWYHEENLWFGHDEPIHKVSWDFVRQNEFQLVLHAKDFKTLAWLRNRDVHHFYHEHDPYTITSHGWIWMYPDADRDYDYLTIMALPEQANLFDPSYLPGIGGVCTDYPHNWKLK
jgi:hypothetical protein